MFSYVANLVQRNSLQHFFIEFKDLVSMLNLFSTKSKAILLIIFAKYAIKMVSNSYPKMFALLFNFQIAHTMFIQNIYISVLTKLKNI